MNITACQHPRLSEALQFPPYGCRRNVVRFESAPKAKPTPEFYAFKALNALFLGISLVAKPLEAVTRGTYAFRPVVIDLGE
ncbi:MAG: hypothetical protein KC800_24890 [Candidatus Eremiobacteraeota bacterium]|nr:hypothetical protein [Candidatus Eremiobacteraeota bacterium]